MLNLAKNPFQIKIIMAFNNYFKSGLQSGLSNTYNIIFMAMVLNIKITLCMYSIFYNQVSEGSK